MNWFECALWVTRVIIWFWWSRRWWRLLLRSSCNLAMGLLCLIRQIKATNLNPGPQYPHSSLLHSRLLGPHRAQDPSSQFLFLKLSTITCFLFLAFQDSSITDIVCLSVCLSVPWSQLTIRAYNSLQALDSIRNSCDVQGSRRCSGHTSKPFFGTHCRWRIANSQKAMNYFRL